MNVIPLVEQVNEETGHHPAVTVVNHYFTQFNQGEYRLVADLFAADGRLLPPFESPVVGRDAIATYLIKEADGMVVDHVSITAQVLKGDRLHVKVRGRVTALVFNVNVAWQFQINSQSEIEQVRVDLLASLEDLLGLRPEKAQ